MATWWRNGVVYQIYPRSFMDSNGDGVGDLPGITSKLDYLQWLGIDALWLSPIFPSPMKDFGYDVSNYTDIHPLFGTLADFDTLLSEAHKRNLRVLLDLVPNHTSDQHAWFKESRSSRDNPKRSWYIWADAKPDGSPPNNWLAYFGGSAWTWDEATGQYYMHNFLPEQPDLNYRNPDVLEAMLNEIRFWLNRDVDGFRVDVIDRMIKDDQLRDNPMNPDYVEGRDNPMWAQQRVYSEGRPEIKDLIRQFRKVFDEYPDRVMIGEIAYSTDPTLIAGYYGDNDLIHLPFNFAPIMLKWDAAQFRAFVDAYEAVLPPGCQPNYVLGNHDMERIASRVGPAQARVGAMMLLTLRGTPFIYQGEELGMLNGDIKPEQYQDPQGINTGVSRDFERTPIHWSAAPYAGFSTVEPWLPVAPDYTILNVESEKHDPRSMLSLYRALLTFRRDSAALLAGRYQSHESPEGTFVYKRTHADENLLIALNFTNQDKIITLPAFDQGETILSTHMDRSEIEDLSALTLRANEGVLIRL